MSDEMVMIYSAEHGYYWRPEGHGYTADTGEAWILPRAEAEKRTNHCGPEKQIKLVPAPKWYAEITDLRRQLASAQARIEKLEGALQKLSDEVYQFLSGLAPCDRGQVCLRQDTDRLSAAKRNALAALAPKEAAHD